MTFDQITAKLSKLSEMAQAAYDRAIYSAEESKRLYDQISDVLAMLDSTLGRMDENSEPLEQKQVKPTCTHPHWEEEPGATMLTVKTCCTCGAQKYA